jgi:hypothetical protein
MRFLAMQVGVLETMEAIFRMFRTGSIELMNEILDYCQHKTAYPVLQCAQVCSSRSSSASLLGCDNGFRFPSPLKVETCARVRPTDCKPCMSYTCRATHVSV